MEASPAERRPRNADWRVFCALELPPKLAQRAIDHINRLRQEFPGVSASWNRDGSFHVTLKFVGEIRPARVERLSLAADRAIKNLSPFDLSLASSGAFPTKGTPRVLWLGISDPSGKLARLQSRLEDEGAAEGFAKDDRSFHPHLTLARLRKPQGARALATLHQEVGFAAIEFTVSELLVIRSELSSKGSKYSVISHHALKASSERQPRD